MGSEDTMGDDVVRVGSRKTGMKRGLNKSGEKRIRRGEV